MSTETMKAIRLHAFGGPEVLQYEDAPRPAPKAGEVLVRVRAAGVNPPDWYLREGYRTLPPDWQPQIALPVIPGTDISGTVEAVGDGVSGFAVGDTVFSMVRFPSFGASAAYAEYVAAPASDLAHKPAGIDHVHAAAVPMALLTAWQFLVELGHDVQNPLQRERHRPVPLAGKTVMVNGAAGGVGHFAVQVAKLQGARVIAVASGGNRDFLLGLGADAFIDYTAVKPEDTVRDVDLVLDTVGGAASGRFIRTIRRGGALFPVYPLGFDSADEAAQAGVTVSATQVRSNGAQLAMLGRLLDDGRICAEIAAVFSIVDARGAHARAAEGHLRGKLVLNVNAPSIR